MATFDRSKFRAAPLATVNSVVKETKQFSTYFGGKNTYAPFFDNKDIADSIVKRVLPAHNPGDSPYLPSLTAMLKCEVDDKDKEGNVLGKKIASKKIFIGTLHGNLPFDIIEEYISRVYEISDSIQGKDEKARFLNPITGYRIGGGKTGTWVPGIRPNLEYMFYDLIGGKIYRDSLKPKQMEALNKESAEIASQNDTVAIDIFSDPSLGFPILWSRGKDDKGKVVETLKSLPLKMGQGWDDYFEKNAVSDKVLEELLSYPSLQDTYVDSYSKRDFDLALDGLKRFDDANIYKIFSQEDFLDKVEQLSVLVQEKKAVVKESSTPKQPKASTPTPVVKKAMPAAKKAVISNEEKMRVINAEFVEQYGDGYDELEIDAFDIEDAYQAALRHDDFGYDIPHVEGWGEEEEATTVPEQDNTPEEEEEEEVPVTTPTPAPKVAAKAVKAEPSTTSGESALDRIRAMRNKK